VLLNLHFAHANGYPPGAYAPLLAELGPHFDVRAMEGRALWPGSTPDGLRDWRPLADDLEADLEAQGARGWLGVGHSLGAILTAEVALRRPEFFGALVLIEPVIFSRALMAAWDVTRRVGLGRRAHPLIPATLRRRRVFADADEMFARYRRAPIFRRLDDDGLWAYVRAMARPRAGGQPGVELAYSPEWEVKIYETGPLDLLDRLHRMEPPVLAIRGAETDTFRPLGVRALKKRLPGAIVRDVPGTGHLAPLEKPAACAQIILEFVESINGSAWNTLPPN
jgi:pimeloyl-ACP methyl ester carboxylesterase